MSTTIPYDPSLDLGNIVPPEHLEVLEKISTLQTPIDEAQNELNSLILLKRKLGMTKDELVTMKVDTADLDKPLEDVDASITAAATKLAEVSVTNLPLISEQRKAIPQISDHIESPIDYTKSQIKQMPLASDSMTMDAQYFSFDETKQQSDSQMSALKSFVSASTSFLGDKASAQATAQTQGQVSHQREVHDIQGTLVITANCTHAQASLFAPFVIDVDKGIRAWNEMVAAGTLSPMIKTNDPGSIATIAEQQETKDAKYFNLLSGVTSGSSFIGMVHVLKDSSTASDQHMRSTAASLQGQMEVGSWFADYKGGFGVDTSFSNSAKSLLSSQNIQSHISLVCMGIIPTIEANDVALTVKQFTDFSPDKMMGQLSVLQNSTADAQSSVSSAAENARTGGQMVALEATKIQSAVSAVGELDDGKNKMLDINSLMTAFTDYVTKAAAGNVGVPINYFLKPITASLLAQMWVAKYLPGEYVTSSGDDSNPDEPKTGGN
jgi:hypothetical protein